MSTLRKTQNVNNELKQSKRDKERKNVDHYIVNLL